MPRWCSPNDVSPPLPSVISEKHYLPSINYSFSSWHFIIFAAVSDDFFWGWRKSVQATFWKVKTNFCCWFWLSLSDSRFGGSDTQWAARVSMIQRAQHWWNNLHSYLKHHSGHVGGVFAKRMAIFLISVEWKKTDQIWKGHKLVEILWNQMERPQILKNHDHTGSKEMSERFSN